MNIGIFKLHGAAIGLGILSRALPRGYFTEFFNGRRLPDTWEPPPFEIRGATARLPDIIAWKEYLPLLSPRAIQLFEEVAPGCAEYREFALIRGRSYCAVNVLATEDIFDLGRSEWTPSLSGEVRNVKRYVFSTEDVPNPMFKLSNFLDGPIFVTRHLAQAIVDAGLLGFQFRDPAVNETPLLFQGVNVNAFPD